MKTISPDGCAGGHQWGFDGQAVGRKLPDCEAPVWLSCAACPRRRLIRCKSSNTDRCCPCGVRYRRRVRRVADSGRVRYPGRQLLLLTLTAPGDGQHQLPDSSTCPCTPAEGVDLAEWNQSLGKRWNGFVLALRRSWGQHVEFFRVVEVQKRGALHLHVMLRLQRGHVVKLAELRRLAIAHGFGHELRCDPVRDEGSAGYVAKYCSKSAGQRGQVPWRRVDRATGEVRFRASYRCWSSSRHWGQTMGGLVAEQRMWAMSGAAPGLPGGGSAAGGGPRLPPEAALDPNSQRSTSLPGFVPTSGHHQLV